MRRQSLQKISKDEESQPLDAQPDDSPVHEPFDKRIRRLKNYSTSKEALNQKTLAEHQDNQVNTDFKKSRSAADKKSQNMDFTSPKKLKSNSINFVDESATTKEKDT